jgi:hypothetical protein
MPSNIRPIRPASTAIRLADELDGVARVAFVRGVRRLGWTIEQAARAAGSSPDAVVKWMSGKRRVPGRALVAVGAIANQNEKAA